MLAAFCMVGHSLGVLKGGLHLPKVNTKRWDRDDVVSAASMHIGVIEACVATYYPDLYCST